MHLLRMSSYCHSGQEVVTQLCLLTYHYIFIFSLFYYFFIVAHFQVKHSQEAAHIMLHWYKVIVHIEMYRIISECYTFLLVVCIWVMLNIAAEYFTDKEMAISPIDKTIILNCLRHSIVMGDYFMFKGFDSHPTALGNSAMLGSK